MTLTAISAELELFSPAVQIKQGEAQAFVAVTIREKQKQGLYCPHCYKRHGELSPVRYRNTIDRTPHFFHLALAEGGKECRSHNNESEKHLAAKVAIAERLKVMQGLVDLSIDNRYLVSTEIVWRKPDILATYANGMVESHEIQISPITSSELLDRTNDQRRHGVGRVVWYLYGASYSPENRSICEKYAITCYHLWFEGSDASLPQWKIASLMEPQPTRPTPSVDRDSCGKSFAAQPAQLTPQWWELPTNPLPPSSPDDLYDWDEASIVDSVDMLQMAIADRCPVQAQAVFDIFANVSAATKCRVWDRLSLEEREILKTLRQPAHA